MAVTVTWTTPLAAPGGAAAVTGAGAGDLTNGATYYYRIAAITGATNTNARPCIPCVEISAAADGNGSIDLSWNIVVGATGYMIWRTPTSGDYSLNYGAGGNLDHDSDMMHLRDGKVHFNWPYTTTSLTYTDTGTASERPSGYAYYRIWMNYPMNADGIGTIVVSGGTVGIPETLDDIYTDAVANGYDTTNFICHYDNNGYRIFECKASLQIQDYFDDRQFSLITWHTVDADEGSQVRTFGDFHADSTTIGSTQFIWYNPVGRLMNHSMLFDYSNIYRVNFIRDFGESNPANTGASQVTTYNDSGSMWFDTDTVIRNSLIENTAQYVYLDGTGIDIDTLDIMRNPRGVYLESSLSGASLVNVRLDNQSYDTNGVSGTFAGGTFYNSAGVHRFYIDDDKTRTLQDCVFPNGHGLPASASQGGGSSGNKIVVSWTFNLKVLDEDKNPIVGASAIITDAQSNVTTDTTDASGDISSVVLTEAEYTGPLNGTFDTTTDFNPYTIEINVNGYQSYFGPIDLEKTEALTITLKKQVCNSMHKTVMLMRG